MNKKTILLTLLLIAIIFLSFYFDFEIVRQVSLIRTHILDSFFLGITFVSSELIIFLFLTILFLSKKQKRKWVLPLWLTLFSSAVISFILKILVKRQRPFQIGIVPISNVISASANFLTWNFSFPSFQSMLAFCAIPFLSKEFPKFRYIWIIFASLVAFSRLYLGVHFLSDIIIGGLIGYLIGYFIIKIEEKNNFGERLFSAFSS